MLSETEPDVLEAAHDLPVRPDGRTESAISYARETTLSRTADVDAGLLVVHAGKLRVASGSGIVTGMGTPGTYRVSDGSRVEFGAAVAAWTAAAVPVLERVARTYHATISYKDLGEEVQQATGIHTRVLLMNWIGQVLGGVSRISRRRGQPMLSALCVHSDATVGEGYGQAILDNYGGPLPGDFDMHAAGERLRCYQSFGADLPPGGGKACSDTAGCRAPGLAGPAVKSRRPKQPVPIVQPGTPGFRSLR